MKTFHRQIAHFAARFTLWLVAIATFSACHAQQPSATADSKRADQYVLFDLIGYNYTDHHIGNYSINGQGGGIIRISSPTSGGGGIVCCLRLAKKDMDAIIVKVKWQVGGCIYHAKSDISSDVYEFTHPFYKEVEVKATRTAGQDPSHIETHFYPDGSIQVQLTEHMSRPHLSLDESRLRKLQLPRCRDDKEPE